MPQQATKPLLATLKGMYEVETMSAERPAYRTLLRWLSRKAILARC